LYNISLSCLEEGWWGAGKWHMEMIRTHHTRGTLKKRRRDISSAGETEKEEKGASVWDLL
jgi:hypothetical protein